ncbi:MAG: GGDEF domain-containing protein [Patescibacteria group bacterium]|nr:GGDEF domain-containing protein [Patescibacteria group bacterium]
MKESFPHSEKAPPGKREGTLTKEELEVLEKDEAELRPVETFLLRESVREHSLDSVTRLKTRAHFEETLQRSLEMIRGEFPEHRAHAEPLEKLSIIFIDLDHFKRINDTHGHQAGDEVLRKVAEILIDSVRETDIVGRIGGEEFGILLRHANEQDAAGDAERIREKIEQLTFEKYPELRVTASFGVASSEQSKDKKGDLWKAADDALYEAKEGDRNQVVIAKT